MSGWHGAGWAVAVLVVCIAAEVTALILVSLFG